MRKSLDRGGGALCYNHCVKSRTVFFYIVQKLRRQCLSQIPTNGSRIVKTGQIALFALDSGALRE